MDKDTLEFMRYNFKMAMTELERSTASEGAEMHKALKQYAYWMEQSSMAAQVAAVEQLARIADALEYIKREGVGTFEAA